MRTLKAWNVYRKAGAFRVFVETVHFQCSMTAEDVWASIEDDYDFAVIVKADDIDDVE